MPVHQVSLRLQSAGHSCADLSAVAGIDPTTCTDRDGRRDSPTPSRTTWILASRAQGKADLSAHVETLAPILGRLATLGRDRTIDADIVVMLTGRAMGDLIDLTDEDIRLIASANCGLVMDVYSEEVEGGVMRDGVSPAGSQVRVSDWIGDRNAKPFAEAIAGLVGYRFDALDSDAIDFIALAKGVSCAYVMEGSKGTAALELAHEIGTSVVEVVVTVPEVASEAVLALLRIMQAYDLGMPGDDH